MPDIFHDFPIRASAKKVFEAISTPEGLDAWWTKTCSASGSQYELGFGPAHQWRAEARSVPDTEFELQMTKSDQDWQNSRVGFVLSEKSDMTNVRFHHIGWPEVNAHYRISTFCWAMYLRLLKRYVETGEVVPYEKRLDA